MELFTNTIVVLLSFCLDLLMHYGTAEKISVKFYEDACNKIEENTQEEESLRPEQKQPSYECRICDLSLDSNRNLLKHLTLRHFPKLLCDDLPKKFPFRCPFIDCHQTRQNLHGLMLHYGMDHVISMELYMKHPKYKQSGQPVANDPGAPGSSPRESGMRVEQYAARSPDSCSSSGAGGMRHELTCMPKPTKLQAVVTPYHPETEEKGPPMLLSHSSPSLVAGPSDPGPSGSGPPSSARVRLLKTWRTGSLEAYKKTIEELESKIRDMEAAHKEKLKEKEKEFERWLTLKESKLEAEMSKCKAMEESLAEKDLSIGDLTAQLELVHDNFSQVEEDLEAKKKLCEDLMAYKEEVIKELQTKEEERLNSYEDLYQKEKELEGIEEKLKEREASVEQLTQQIKEQTEEMAGVQTIVFSFYDEVSKFALEIEQKAKPVKDKETKSIKMVITRDGSKTRSVKKFKAVRSKVEETESQQEEKKNIKETLVQLRSSVKGFYEAFLEKDQEVGELEQKVRESEFKAKDLESKTDVLKALEKEKKDLAKKVKGLETTLADWETRQFTNLKLISGLEKERDSLQGKLKELQDGNLSHEDQLYWKDVAIKNKEKEVKSLKAIVDEKEVKIVELDKENQESQSRVKTLAEQESSLQVTNAALEQLNKKNASEMAELNKQIVNQANEIKHLKIALSQKTKEWSAINTTAVCQKAELDRLLRENEKFESDYSKAITQLEIVKNSKKDLLKKLQQKELNLQTMKSRLVVLNAKEKAREEDRLEMEMRNQVLSDMDKVIQIQQMSRVSHQGIWEF